MADVAFTPHVLTRWAVAAARVRLDISVMELPAKVNHYNHGHLKMTEFKKTLLFFGHFYVNKQFVLWLLFCFFNVLSSKSASCVSRSPLGNFTA